MQLYARINDVDASLQSVDGGRHVTLRLGLLQHRLQKRVFINIIKCKAQCIAISSLYEKVTNNQ